MSIYPNAIPTIAQVFEYADDVHWMNAAKWTVMRNELIAALTELGTNPKGSFADVKARLDDMLPHFHDRGDPNTWDFLTEDFIADSKWHDLDLSGIVPSGCKAVVFSFYCMAEDITGYVQAKEKGNAYAINTSTIYLQVSNKLIRQDFICPITPDSFLEYRAREQVWGLIAFGVKGWFK